ncbi:SSI family serine proteinase inhibitor [Streptomyces sp. NPDC046887]|uniref:SSI family serine proteinase inhibitor n=1 Tax=Streptomyces sp. NPDC046887 TaxID=3155472 RepID=UPI0033E6E8B1
MLRRLFLTSAASLAVLGAAAPGAVALDSPLPLPLLAGPDKLTITIADSGYSTANGTFELECDTRSAVGTHPRAKSACDRLDELAAQDRDPFAPVAEGTMCTMQHGGPATAHITGTWRGEDVDARFSRTDGCEIARWDALKPVLPRVRS